MQILLSIACLCVREREVWTVLTLSVSRFLEVGRPRTLRGSVDNNAINVARREGTEIREKNRRRRIRSWNAFLVRANEGVLSLSSIPTIPTHFSLSLSLPSRIFVFCSPSRYHRPRETRRTRSVVTTERVESLFLAIKIINNNKDVKTIRTSLITRKLHNDA